MDNRFQEMMEVFETYIYGQQHNIRLLVCALLAGGHVLLEGAPGTGKTKMVRTLAQLLAASFQRVQFTPDLLPSDITGSTMFNVKEGVFQTIKGPVFTNIFLADEINRTPPRTQAALLEAMEEKQVTIFGETHRLAEPFFLAATQNPIDYEGTYPLPEAQKDRFLFHLHIDYPDLDSEIEMLDRSVQGKLEERLLKPMLDLEAVIAGQQEAAAVLIEPSLLEYIAKIIRATRESELVRLGASPRSAIALAKSSQAWALLSGRSYVTPDDIKTVLFPVLRHRLALAIHVELEGGTSDQVIQNVVASIPVPR